MNKAMALPENRYIIVRISYKYNKYKDSSKPAIYFVYASDKVTAIINTIEKNVDKRDLRHMPNDLEKLLQYYFDLGEDIYIEDVPVNF